MLPEAGSASAAAFLKRDAAAGNTYPEARSKSLFAFQQTKKNLSFQTGF